MLGSKECVDELKSVKTRVLSAVVWTTFDIIFMNTLVLQQRKLHLQGWNCMQKHSILRSKVSQLHGHVSGRRILWHFRYQQYWSCFKEKDKEIPDLNVLSDFLEQCNEDENFKRYNSP